MNDTIKAVPTNIITGFLGAGKTSAILNLLKNKPDNERWAVLVNEFGEIGVDGSLFKGLNSQQDSVFIREVPGGCMCCAAGLPMQIALNQLISRAKPDRLLIEPTGLGHPQEIVEILSSDYYAEVVSLQKTLTLVDARKLSDARYTKHDTFNQQIAIADAVIGNKMDLYQASDKEALIRYVAQNNDNNAVTIFSEYGEIHASQLRGKTAIPYQKSHLAPPKSTANLPENTAIPECGYIKAVNEGEGFYSVGWRFSPDTIFNHNKLLTLLTGLQVERLKAVFITEQGIFGYNLTEDALTEIELDECLESRVEIISDQPNDSLETQLMASIET